MSVTTKTTKEADGEAVLTGVDGSTKPSMIVAELKKRYTAQQIKRLHKGKGRLTEDLTQFLAKLTNEKVLPTGSPAVVIVVREREDDFSLF